MIEYSRFWKPLECSWMMFLKRESRERKWSAAKRKEWMEGSPLIYRGEFADGGGCADAYPCVRPYTPPKRVYSLDVVLWLGISQPGTQTLIVWGLEFFIYPLTTLKDNGIESNIDRVDQSLHNKSFELSQPSGPNDANLGYKIYISHKKCTTQVST